MKIRNQQKSVAANLIEIAQPSDLIMVFPAGTVPTADGRGPYKLSDPDGVISASLRENVDLVIDREHAYDLLPKGTPVKAAGWIKELINRDGAILARVEWTPAAQQELLDKEYRYISPTFFHTKDTKEVTRIIRATLTNNPNFDMAAIASASHEEDFDNPQSTEDELMKPELIALAAALGLAAATEEKDILATAAARIAAHNAEEAALKAALKLDIKASSKEVLDTASSLFGKSADQPDPTKFVPMELFKATASQLEALQKDTHGKQASEAVEKGMKEGKITPAMKDWAMSCASQSLEQFGKYLESAPVIVSGQADDTQKGDGSGAGTGSLSDEDKAFCSAIGLSPEDFKKQQDLEVAA